MRLLCFFCLAVLAMPEAGAQPVKATSSQAACESLCAELFTAIRAEPDKMVMRLEEALVINEHCAGAIVTAAIDAVNSEPAMVRKIVDTAMDVTPQRAPAITAAVKNYNAPTIAMATPVANPTASSAGEVEVRRAQLPDEAEIAALQPKLAPGEEVRRAELPLANRSLPIVEIRRAEPPSPAIPIIEPAMRSPRPMAVQQSQPTLNLSNVPKAKPLKKSRR